MVLKTLLISMFATGWLGNPCRTLTQASAGSSSAVITMKNVPAGTFVMGRRDDGYDKPNYDTDKSDEVPRHEVTLSAYRIGKYEVTNGQACDILNWAKAKRYLKNSSGAAYNGGDVFAAGKKLLAVSDATCQIQYASGVFSWKSRAGKDNVIYSMENHPVIHITWYGCVALCNWLSERQGLELCYGFSDWELIDADSLMPGFQFRNGYRLPTEAEWERAAAWDTNAAGGPKHWIFGFMRDDPGYGSLDGMAAYANCFAGTYQVNPLGLSPPPTAPVGWFDGKNVSPSANVPGHTVPTMDARSPVGAYDMTGNVSEWCYDRYGPYSAAAQIDPTGSTSADHRVQRDGAWGTHWVACRTATRQGNYPADYSDHSTGFRLCRSGLEPSASHRWELYR